MSSVKHEERAISDSDCGSCCTYQNSAEKLPCVDIKLNFRFVISTTVDTNAFFGNRNTLYKNGFQAVT